MNKIKRIAEIRELLMQDAEEQCICRTRGYLTANFYMEICKKNYEVELIVDEDWQCSDCSVYNVEEDVEDVKLKIIILNEYSELYATLKREAYEKLDREAKLYEEHEQSLMYDLWERLINFHLLISILEMIGYQWNLNLCVGI